MKQNVPPIPGVRDLATLLRFLDNRKEYDKHIANLEKSRKRLNESVELVGKASEIQNMRIRAEQELNTASKTLEEALANASQCEDDAVAKAAEKIEKATARAQQINTESADQQAELANGLKELSQLQKQLAQDQKSLADDQAKATAMMNSASKKQAEYTELAQRLQGAMKG